MAYSIGATTPFHSCMIVPSPKLVSSEGWTGATLAFYCSSKGGAPLHTPPPVQVERHHDLLIFGLENWRKSIQSENDDIYLPFSLLFILPWHLVYFYNVSARWLGICVSYILSSKMIGKFLFSFLRKYQKVIPSFLPLPHPLPPSFPHPLISKTHTPTPTQTLLVKSFTTYFTILPVSYI
jgi:hypothetical protein